MFSVAQSYGCSQSSALGTLITPAVTLVGWELPHNRIPLPPWSTCRSLYEIWKVEVKSSLLLLEGQWTDARCPMGLSLYLLTSALTPIFPMNDPDDRQWPQPPLATGLQTAGVGTTQAQSKGLEISLMCFPLVVPTGWPLGGTFSNPLTPPIKPSLLHLLSCLMANGHTKSLNPIALRNLADK